MSALIYLIPAALLLGLVGFLWALRSGQFDDLDGTAHRVLLDEDDKPLPPNGDAGNARGSQEDSGYRPTVSL